MPQYTFAYFHMQAPKKQAKELDEDDIAYQRTFSERTCGEHE